MLKQLITEQRNKNSMNLDELSIFETIELMNKEDLNVIEAVKNELKSIEKVIETTVNCLKQGGRLIYVGAGTSGRIGVLDAVECPPTFGMSVDKVVGVLAGGMEQMFAKEEAEDSEELGKNDMLNLSVSKNDIVIGIAASGRTPYVIGALKYANEVGAKTASICCNKNSKISEYSKLPIELDNGAEILTGSTRLKAGTSQKMVCNMISTVSMIKLGKVYENLMVDVDVSNEKLYERWLNIVMTATDCDIEKAKEYYKKSNHNAKAAICMIKLGISYETSMEELNKNDESVKKVINSNKI